LTAVGQLSDVAPFKPCQQGLLLRRCFGALGRVAAAKQIRGMGHTSECGERENGNDRDEPVPHVNLPVRVWAMTP
jgi:hypothetical protein